MSGKVRRVDFHPDEYITGVGGVLTAEEQGVYWMVCAIIMSEGGPIPYNERRLAAQCLLRPSRLRKVVDALVGAGKLILSDDGKLSQKRALSEIEKSTKRIQTASENGSKGGRPAQKAEQIQETPKATGSGADKLTTNHQPATTNQKDIAVARPKPARRRHSYTEEFSRFWDPYPTDSLMSKSEAFKAFDKMPADEQESAIQSVPAFAAYCSAHPDYRPIHASRYLSQRRWEGFLKTQQRVSSRVFVAAGTPAWDALLRKRGVTSLPLAEHEGKKGWHFDRREVEEATSAGHIVDWKTRGAA